MTKKCFFYDCKKTARFNYSDEKIPVFCQKHAHEGMINIKPKKNILDLFIDFISAFLTMK